MRGTNSKNDINEKTRPTTTSLGLWGVEMALKSRDPTRHIYGTYWMYIPNFNFLVQFVEEIGEEQLFFEVKKGRNPHICPPNWLGELIFRYVMQLLIFYRLAQKRANFLFFRPHTTLFSKLRHDWILTQVHPHSYTSNTPSKWADWLNLSDFVSITLSKCT